MSSQAEPQPLRRLFGRRVREVRTRLGLTQQELGRRAGMHPAYVGGVERGERNITLEAVERLARALAVAPADLMLEEPLAGPSATATEARIRALAARAQTPGDLAAALEVAALFLDQLNLARRSAWAAEPAPGYADKP